MRAPIDWKMGHVLALECMPRWAPATLGRRLAWYPPGAVKWWPNIFDAVSIYGGPRVVCLGDWSGRFRIGDTWGCDLVELVAELRRCRPGQALSYICRHAGVPDLPRVSGPVFRRAAA